MNFLLYNSILIVQHKLGLIKCDRKHLYVVMDYFFDNNSRIYLIDRFHVSKRFHGLYVSSHLEIMLYLSLNLFD